MKRRHREINIFGMSALDLFASALGAFILIAVVLFPYFPNIGSSPEHVTALRAQLREAQEQLQTCQANLTQAQTELTQTQAELTQAQTDLTQAQADLQQCTRELRKKFLLILISWGTRDDVDLFVRDPQGNVFFYKKKAHHGTPAKFEEDNTRGPGNEIWLHPQTTPGRYEICYHFYDNHSGGNSVRVRGAYLTPAGRRALDTVTLSPPNLGAESMEHVATIVIDNEGNATRHGGSSRGTCGIEFGGPGK